jgi:hypothetical protein
MLQLLNKLYEKIESHLIVKSKVSRPIQNRSLQRHVKYQFHLPGVNNFHLLPFKNKLQGSLNIFKPHWNKSGFMQSTTSKSVR